MNAKEARETAEKMDVFKNSSYITVKEIIAREAREGKFIVGISITCMTDAVKVQLIKEGFKVDTSLYVICNISW